MAYFVVERSRDDGTLSIPLPDAYETRDAAITALSAATASGAISLQGEVFIADLGSAVPVLVMPSAPAVAPVAAAPAEEGAPADAEEPIAEEVVSAEAEEPVAEEPVAEELEIEPEPDGSSTDDNAEPGELDEADADTAFTAWEPLAEITAAESTLADALKRAATSLEEEGIVAPDSVVSGGEPLLEEVVSAEAEEVVSAEPEEVAADVAEEVVSSVAEEVAADVAEEVPPVEAASGETSAWPWANVESYEIKVDAAEILEPEDEPVSEPETSDLDSEIAALAAPSAEAPEDDLPAEIAEIVPEEQAIITSAPAEGEEAYMPQPVILGDYLDSVTAAVEEPGEPEAPVSEQALEPEVEPAEEPEASPAEDVVAAAAAAVPEVGYEATGELKLEEYTCQDCVYSNTCPKVGQTTPAECGSFQWRSE